MDNNIDDLIRSSVVVTYSSDDLRLLPCTDNDDVGESCSFPLPAAAVIRVKKLTVFFRITKNRWNQIDLNLKTTEFIVSKF
jgi:hypothetical protein